MRIAIEAQRIFRPQKHGMDFVALEFIRELQKLDRQNEYYIFVRPDRDICLQETKNFKIIPLNCPTYLLWEQFALPRAVQRLKPDLLHCTSNTAPLRPHAKLVLTLHDIIYLDKSLGIPKTGKTLYQKLGYNYRRLIVPRIVGHCSKIITVSYSEEKRIRELLRIKGEILTTVYNGYNSRFQNYPPHPGIRKKYNLPEKYIFFLGNTDPKKNSENVLLAYAGYRAKTRTPLPLVVADLTEKAIRKLLQKLKYPELRQHIVLTDYIPNAELPYIYSMAHMMLYPSLQESFGIPILEAMACGIPVITSNNSSMPEIAGPEGIFADPRRPEEIADAILRLDLDETFRQAQIAYGLERVKKFTWKNTALQIKAIYNNLK